MLSSLKSSEKNTHTSICYNDTIPIKLLVLQKWQGYCSGTWKNGTWPGTKGSGEEEECWGKNKNITKGKLNCCCFFVFKSSRSRHRQNVTEIHKHKWQCYMLWLEIRVKLKLFPLFSKWSFHGFHGLGCSAPKWWLKPFRPISFRIAKPGKEIILLSLVAHVMFSLQLFETYRPWLFKS